MKLARGVRSPFWLCMALVGALSSGCKAKPATVELAPVSQQPILSFEAVPVPAVVVKDEKGQPLEEQPEVEFSSEPSGFVVVTDGKFHPQRSGTGLLVARVKDTGITATAALDIRLLDKVELSCPNNPECGFQPGQPVELQARILSNGTPVENVPSTWTSSDPAVVKVDGPGKLQALALGEAEIRVESLNNTRASQKVRIVQPTHISVKCGDSDECSVEAGKRLKLTAQVFADTVPVGVKELFWSSPSPDLLTVDQQGVAEGLQEGLVTLTVSGAGVEGQVKVNVKLPPARVIVSRADSSDEEKGKSAESASGKAEFITLPNGRTIPVFKAPKNPSYMEMRGLPQRLDQVQQPKLNLGPPNR